MRSRLRLFLLVGLLATAVDVTIVAVLGSISLVGADLLALALAAALAYGLNRSLTFRGDPTARWVRRPLWFTATAVGAGIVDLSVLLVLDWIGLPLLLAKLVAVFTAAAIRWMAYRRILFTEVRRDLAQREERPAPIGAPRLSVIIPAYHEEGLIGRTVAAIEAELLDALGGRDFEVVVVDDGSTDGTSAEARAAGARVVELEVNQGKGAAVRAGVAEAEGRSLVFTDADLAYHPSLIPQVLAELEDGWDVVVGSRRHDDTNTLVRARRIRELGGRVINLLTHIVLLGNFHDTQCGLKGFRGDVGKTVFQRTRVDGFAFDVELFLIAEQDRLSLTEIPVAVTNRGVSSVRVVSHTMELLADLVRIRRWAGSGVYNPTPRQAAVLSARREPSECP